VTKPTQKTVLVTGMWDAFVDAVRARSPRSGTTSRTFPAWTEARPADPMTWSASPLAAGLLVWRCNVDAPLQSSPFTPRDPWPRVFETAHDLEIDPDAVLAGYQSSSGRVVLLSQENARFALVTTSHRVHPIWAPRRKWPAETEETP